MIRFCTIFTIRTDRYIPCTDEVGVKLRGKNELLEVKVRTTVDKSGIEYWEKIERCHLDPSKDVKDVAVGVLQSLATQSSHRPALLRAVEVLKTDQSAKKTFTLHKTRKCGDYKGVEIEQADIELVEELPSSVSPGNHTSPVLEGAMQKSSLPSQWRSVSFEEDKPEKILSLLSQLGAEGGSLLPPDYKQLTSAPMGYPAFVLSLQS